MARTTMTLEVRMAWWVRPYLMAAVMAVKTVEPFCDIDDDHLADFVERQAAFVARHGILIRECK